MKMYLYVLVSVCLLAGVQDHSAQTKRTHAASPKFICLPAEIEPDSVVEVKQIKWMGGIRLTKETVRQRLSKLKARCKAGKLLDQKGK